MNFYFADENIKQISEVLGTDAEKFDNGWTWKLNNPAIAKPLYCTLYNSNEDKNLPLISVQTQHGYYEMHNITDFMVFEPDEIFFVNSEETKISCLILGRGGNCSLFSNISRDLIGADFAELDPALLLSAMQLSITESIIN
jgi:hypothetical protein